MTAPAGGRGTPRASRVEEDLEPAALSRGLRDAVGEPDSSPRSTKIDIATSGLANGAKNTAAALAAGLQRDHQKTARASVVVDPRSGPVLAMVSIRLPPAASPRALQIR